MAQYTQKECHIFSCMFFSEKRNHTWCNIQNHITLHVAKNADCNSENMFAMRKDYEHKKMAKMLIFGVGTSVVMAINYMMTQNIKGSNLVVINANH